MGSGIISNVCLHILWLGNMCNFSAVIDVNLICCLLHTILLPFVIICMVYDWSWSLWYPFQTIVPWVHGPPSTH